MEPMKCFVFALTPRAGRKHHVFLFPEQAPPEALDLAASVASKVEEILTRYPPEEVRNGIITANFGIVGVEVVQPSTNRCAFEWICLVATGLQQLGGEVQDRLLHRLKDGLKKLQHWVQSEPDRWDKVQGERISCPILTRAQEQFEEMMPDDIRLEPQPDSYPPSKRKVFKGLCLVVTVGLASALAPLALGVFFGSSDCLSLVGVGRPPYSAVARVLGLPPDASAEQLARKLRSIALWEPPERGAKPQNGPLARTQDFEAEVHKCLVFVDQKVNKSRYETPPPLQNLVRYNSLHVALEKLFPRERRCKFDPLALVRASGDPQAEELAEWFEGVDRFTCISLLCIFDGLNRISPEVKSQIMSDLKRYPPQNFSAERAALLSDIFRLAERQPVRDSCKLKERYPFPLFFLQEEAQLLASLKELLTVLCQMCYGSQVTSWQKASALLRNADEGSICNALIEEARANARRAEDGQLKQGWEILADVLESLADVLERVSRECQSFSGSR